MPWLKDDVMNSSPQHPSQLGVACARASSIRLYSLMTAAILGGILAWETAARGGDPVAPRLRSPLREADRPARHSANFDRAIGDSTGPTVVPAASWHGADRLETPDSAIALSIDSAGDRVLPPRRTPEATGSRSRGSREPQSIVGVVVSLGLLAGALAGAGFWLKRSGHATFRSLPIQALEPMGRRVIGPRQSIQLVRLGGRILVLGVSPDGINTLAEISDPVEVDLLAGACQANPESEFSFQSLFASRSSASKTPFATVLNRQIAGAEGDHAG